MGNLKKTDLLFAMLFGCIISIICFYFQLSKKASKTYTKKQYSQSSVASQSEIIPFEKIHRAPKPQYTQRSIASVDDSNSFSFSEESEYIEYDNGTTHENKTTPTAYEVSLSTDRELESYLFNQFGLPENEISNIIAAKRQMEDEINKNNTSISALASEEPNSELQILNQQAMSRYQEELKQILGPENYQRYAIWQSEQSSALGESYAGGTLIKMDDI